MTEKCSTGQPVQDQVVCLTLHKVYAREVQYWPTSVRPGTLSKTGGHWSGYNWPTIKHGNNIHIGQSVCNGYNIALASPLRLGLVHAQVTTGQPIKHGDNIHIGQSVCNGYNLFVGQHWMGHWTWGIVSLVSQLDMGLSHRKVCKLVI